MRYWVEREMQPTWCVKAYESSDMIDQWEYSNKAVAILLCYYAV